jgi:hypothetical protein
VVDVRGRITVPDINAPISRRRAIALGGATVGGLIAASSPFVTSRLDAQAKASSGDLPVDEIERILETPGTVMSKVLSISQDRGDIHATVFRTYPVLPAWALSNEFHFEPIGGGRAALDGEITVLEEEVTPVIDKLVGADLEVMGLHNHLIQMRPIVWYVHYKGFGDPITLAQGSIAAVRETHTPLPQQPPDHPETTLDVDALERILGGTAMVQDQGVVEVDVPRRETITVEGVVFDPDMGVQVQLYLEPLDGHRAAIHAELACVAAEVPVVVRALRAQDFVVTASHHHEIGEHPQLYFVHAFGAGVDVDLARRMSTVLGHMNLERR